MSLIDWRDEFEIGIPAVDAEHRELIAAINDLHRMLEKDAASDAVTAALGDIYALIAAHFALEERYMRDTQYDGFRAHKDDHETLLEDLRDIMDRVDDEGDYDESRLARELDDWFTLHFRTHDSKLHRHEQSRPRAR